MVALVVEEAPVLSAAYSSLSRAVALYRHTVYTMATAAGRLYDTEAALNMLMNSDSEEEIGEPMCPESDEEFPDPDLDSDELLQRYTYVHNNIIIA